MIQDNTTKWKVRKFTDFASNQALPVGFMYQHLSPIVPVGSLPLLGGTYDRSLYADLWSWANENGLVVSEADWQSMVTAQGGSCAKFSDGNGSTTFRVPALKCWVKGANGIEEVGSYLDAGLPNITGERNAFIYDTWYRGALQEGSWTSDFAYSLSTSGSYALGNVHFDASLSNPTYGNSDTVQPPSIVAMYCIVAYGTVTNVGNADVANVMQAVERVQIELPKKANLGALSMPTSSAIEVNVGNINIASDTMVKINEFYTAPADGWLRIIGFSGNSRVSEVIATIAGNKYAKEVWSEANTEGILFVPIRKGAIATVDYRNLASLSCYFFYAQSEV